MASVPASDSEQFSKRQGEVLDAALKLLVAGGDRLTMKAIAGAASCSKETLYNWFGDRDGVLAAIVRRQASKVGIPVTADRDLDLVELRTRLEAFARDLLTVLSGDMSVALNRLAVSHAGSENSALGRIVLENGRFAMGKRLKPLIEAGQSANLLDISEDSETQFRTFFGLVVRDVQIRLLLGDNFELGANEIAAEAKRASDQFIQLYSTENSNQQARIRAV